MNYTALYYLTVSSTYIVFFNQRWQCCLYENGSFFQIFFQLILVQDSQYFHEDPMVMAVGLQIEGCLHKLWLNSLPLLGERLTQELGKWLHKCQRSFLSIIIVFSNVHWPLPASHNLPPGPCMLSSIRPLYGTTKPTELCSHIWWDIHLEKSMQVWYHRRTDL